MGGYMSTFDIVTRGEMADLTAYLTHLEGTATFAQFNGNPPPFPPNAWDEYFEIYDYYHKNPNLALTDKDWDKINILSDKKRLWYTVGAEIASLVDKREGRHTMVSSIKRPSKNFISAVR